MTRTVIKSKRIYTGLSGVPFDGYVIIEDGYISDVVPIESSQIGIKDNVIDYGDCTVMPSFHDAHLHLIVGAISEKGGFLRSANSEEEAAKMLYDLNKDKPKEKWLMGGAWDHFKWPGQKLPGRKSLDKYFPDQMVFLLNKECHGAWVNTKTLEYFNITSETPDPEFGKIFKDEKGEPTGYLHEFVYTDLLKKILADMTDEEMAGYVKAFSKKAHSLGITSVSDMQIDEICPYQIYRNLNAKDQLDIRIHYSAPFTYETKRLLEMQTEDNYARLRFSGTKDFVDGTPMGHTGLMIEPYNDRPDFYGESAIDLGYLKSKIIELDANDIRVRLHACGDDAVRVALDCFEEARKINGYRGNRHSIEHIEACSPDDIGRFAKLNVIPSVQPDHMPKYEFANHPFHKILGEERMRFSWPFNSLLSTGSTLAFGTDYPVSELTPFRGIFRAVTRLTDDNDPAGGFSPPEKMSLQDSLRAYTYGAAYVNEREDDLGTLAPGKRADITVLDRDILNTPVEKIKETNIAATYMDGEEVFVG